MNHACYLSIFELHNPTIPSPFYAKKGDTGRKLQFILTDKGNPYIISTDCYAVFTAKKPDGAILYNDCAIEDNAIVYTFTPQTCSCVGSLSCEVRLYGTDDQLITAPTFTLIVEDTVYSDGDIVESASEVTALTALLTQVNELIGDIEQKLEENAFADAHSAVCYTSQNLTNNQKEQARTNIGAAPTGFGLNNEFTTISSADLLDNYVTCGWVRYINSTTAVTSDICQALIRIDSFSNSTSGPCVIQTLYPFYGTFSTGCAMQRICYLGTWNDWEWVNPPMKPDVEYRTTERWNGKPVYQRMVDLGAMPNASQKTLTITLPSGTLEHVLEIIGTTSQGDTLPYQTTVSEFTLSASYASSTTINIIIITSTDKSAYTATVVVKYVKK